MAPVSSIDRPLAKLARSTEKLLELADRSTEQFACDRCREKKLRCVRIEEFPNACTRCIKSNVDVCITSKKRRRRTKRKPSNAQDPSFSQSCGRRQPGANSLDTKPATGHRMLAKRSRSSTANVNSPLTPPLWHDQSIGESDADSPPSFNQGHSSDRSYSIDSSAIEPATPESIQTEPRDTVSLRMLEYDESSEFPKSYDGFFGAFEEDHFSFLNPKMSSYPEAITPGRIFSQDQPPIFKQPTCKLEECMRQLSTLSTALYNQSALLRSSSSDGTFMFRSESSWNHDKIVGDVFLISQRFLELLQRIRQALDDEATSAHDAQQSEYSSPTLTQAWNQSLFDTGNSYSDDMSMYCPSSASPRSSTISPSSFAHLSRTSTTSSMPLHRTQLSDTAMTLLMFTCYASLTDMYDALFARLQIHLPTACAGGDAVPFGPPLPAMRIGSFDPSRHSDIQIAILLQTSLLLLDRVGQAIGLPDEYLVARQSDNDDNGIVSRRLSGDMMDMVMKQGGTQARANDRGGSGLRGLRDRVRVLRQHLRGCTVL